jgi:hypothetical protein
MTLPNGWDGPGYFAAQLAPEPVRTSWTTPVAEPGIVPPRPLQFGDIIGGAFRAVRFAPMTMFGLTLVVLMVAQVLGLGVGYVLGRQFGESLVPFDEDFGTSVLFSWSTVAALLANSLTSVVVGMGLFHTVVAGAAARRVPPREALRHMVSRMWPALAYTALAGAAGVAAVAPILLILSPLFGSDTEPAVLALLLLVAAVGVLAAVFGTRVLLAPCVIAVEGLGPLRAIRRSWTLTKGLFWRLLGTYLLSSVIISLAGSTVSGVFSFGGALLGLADANLAMVGLTTASQLSSTVLTLPLLSAVQALLYVDARIRHEGYDLELSEALFG